MIWQAVLLCSLVIAGWGVALAQEPLLRGSQPISLHADQLTTDTANRTATFSGRVAAQQGDLTITSDRLLVRYAAKGNDVDEVQAVGNVRITQGERIAFAGRAVYDNRAGIIRLEDKPRIQQGEDSISGVVIMYFVNEMKSVVTGGPGQRVEAVIRPGGERIRVPGTR